MAFLFSFRISLQDFNANTSSSLAKHQRLFRPEIAVCAFDRGSDKPSQRKSLICTYICIIYSKQMRAEPEAPATKWNRHYGTDMLCGAKARGSVYGGGGGEAYVRPLEPSLLLSAEMFFFFFFSGMNWNRHINEMKTKQCIGKVDNKKTLHFQQTEHFDLISRP